MAELADALDLGSSEATRTGSIPATRTTCNENAPLFWTKIGTITREIFLIFWTCVYNIMA